MTFPTITYKFNGIEEAKLLTSVVEQKLAPLGRMIDESSNPHCEIEFEKLTTQQHGRVFRAEANLSVGGTLYRAEATEMSFESAIDEVRDELDKELSRAKDRHITRDRVAEREAKEQLING